MIGIHKLKTLAGAAFLAATLGLSASAHALDKVTVVTDFPPVTEHAALHLAKIKGWYKKAGLDVQIMDGKGSINAIQLVGAGRMDVGYASLGPLAIARDQGMDLISIAGFGRKTDLGVIVPKDSNIHTAKDLKGKSVALFTTSPWVPFVPPFLKAAGLTPQDVNIVYYEPTAIFSVYSAKRSDAVMTLIPYGLPLVDPQRPSRAIAAADYGIAFPGFGLFTRTALVHERAAVLSRFVTVTAKAWQYIFDGHQDEGVRAIMQDRPDVKINPAVGRAQIDLYKEFAYGPNTMGKPIGWQSEKDWAAGIATMEQAKLIKPGHKPSDYFTNALLEKAKK